MKFLALLLVFGCVSHDTPEPHKIYISSTIDGLFEMYSFYGKDSVGYLMTKKYPGVEYDFFGEKNITLYKNKFAKRKDVDNYKYLQKGDSIFIDRSDKFLTIICSGILKENKMVLSTTISIINKTNLSKEIVKSTPNLIYHPY